MIRSNTDTNLTAGRSNSLKNRALFDSAQQNMISYPQIEGVPARLNLPKVLSYSHFNFKNPDSENIIYESEREYRESSKNYSQAHLLKRSPIKRASDRSNPRAAGRRQLEERLLSDDNDSSRNNQAER